MFFFKSLDMKNTIIVLSAGLLMFSVSCKCKEKTSPTQQTQQTQQTQTTKDPKMMAPVSDKTLGMVSYQYKSTGCTAVVIVQTEIATQPLILIPMNPLPAGIDKDGLEIYFDYRPLKMPNPKGCNAGIPAELTNISKK